MHVNHLVLLRASIKVYSFKSQSLGIDLCVSRVGDSSKGFLEYMLSGDEVVLW